MTSPGANSHKYKITYYKATPWSLLTQADHFEEVIIDSPLSLDELAKQIAANGVELERGKKWLMPGAILEVSKV